jgi:hypothetical protein
VFRNPAAAGFEEEMRDYNKSNSTVTPTLEQLFADRIKAPKEDNKVFERECKPLLATFVCRRTGQLLRVVVGHLPAGNADTNQIVGEWVLQQAQSFWNLQEPRVVLADANVDEAKAGERWADLCQENNASRAIPYDVRTNLPPEIHAYNDEIIYCPNNAEVPFSKVLTMSENVVLQLFKETDQSGKHMHKVIQQLWSDHRPCCAKAEFPREKMKA